MSSLTPVDSNPTHRTSPEHAAYASDSDHEEREDQLLTMLALHALTMQRPEVPSHTHPSAEPGMMEALKAAVAEDLLNNHNGSTPQADRMASAFYLAASPRARSRPEPSPPRFSPESRPEEDNQVFEVRRTPRRPVSGTPSAGGGSAGAMSPPPTLLASFTPFRDPSRK